MNTGGLAQMSYHEFPSTGGLGLPGSGYASRGKGAHIKRLSVASPPQINAIHEDQVDVNPTPRTSRSHLLAGLRTAPKQTSVPASAPYNQSGFGAIGSGLHNRNGSQYGMAIPQTANPFGTTAPRTADYFNQPDVAFGSSPDRMDPQLYEEIMAQNAYLMQRKQQLQQQLLDVTAAANRFSGMNLNGNQHAPLTPLSPQPSMYSPNGQPILQPVHNQPGLYTVFNPLTGQSSLFMDPALQTSQLPISPASITPPRSGSSPDYDAAPALRRDNISPANGSSWGKPRSVTPPKSSPSPPQDVTPLPPPSANAFRPGHRKSMSTAMAGLKVSQDLGKGLNAPKSAAFPPTPQTGTFGLGMGRAGEHPMRQPRGPPPLEELVQSPTQQHEGSKNFAARQRRRAVHNLLKAGAERRRNGSSDGDTPSSESEFNFTVTPDGGMASSV